MDCPKCRMRALCTDSRSGVESSTYRRYRCPKCKSRWTTMETFLHFGTKQGKTVYERAQSKHREMALKALVDHLQEQLRRELAP